MVDMCFAPGPEVPQELVVADCLAVGHSIRGGVDERVVLFVKLEEGCSLGSELEKKLRSEIRARRTARHVPERVSRAEICASALHISFRFLAVGISFD